jgi:hypothetical protein
MLLHSILLAKFTEFNVEKLYLGTQWHDKKLSYFHNQAGNSTHVGGPWGGKQVNGWVGTSLGVLSKTRNSGWIKG